MTAQELITRSLRLIGALASGESPSSAEAHDCLHTLNAMVDSWAAHRMVVSSLSRTPHTLVVGTQTYAIGSTVVVPDFAQTQPAFLSGVGILTAVSPTIESPLESLTNDQWMTTSIKSESGTPTAYYYRNTQPLAYISFWPVPDAADTVVLYWPIPIHTFVNLTTNYTFAFGYEEALKFNLAIRLAPEFGRPVDQMMMALANETLATVKRSNTELMEMTVDPALLVTGTSWNIKTGE